MKIPALCLALLLAGPAWGQGADRGFDDVLAGRQVGSQRPLHPILTAAFQAGTDQATGYPASSGNRFELLETGVVSFPRKLELIEQARDCVMFSTMIAVEDESGRAMRRALVRAARRGVRVFAILDGNLADPRFLLKLKLGGVKVVRFNKIFKRQRSGRLHMKSVIVDSRLAVLGGMNLTDDYNLGDGHNQFFKDTDLLVEGDAARQAAQHFASLWQALHPHGRQPAVERRPLHPIHDPRRGVARFIAQESDRGQTTIRDYYLRCFYAANELIIWHVNNIKPQGPLIEALAAAAARGVRVVCITNSIHATNGLYGDKVGKVWYEALSRQRDRLRGVELWELDVPVHSKALVVDGVMAAVGSYNIGSAKSDENLESTFVVYDADLVGQVEAMLFRDLARSKRAR